MKSNKIFEKVFVSLFLLTSLYSATFADVKQKEIEYGHSTEIRGNVPAEIRSSTDQPGIPPVQIRFDSLITGSIGRDEGEGEELWAVTDSNGICDKVVISADGRWVAIGYTLNNERLEVRNARDGELVFDFEVEEGSSHIDMTAEGDWIGYSSRDSVWLFTLDSEGNPFFRFSLDGYSAGPIKLTRDGEYFVTTWLDRESEENLVVCFRDADPEPLWTFAAPARETFGWYGINISRDRSVVAVNGKYRFYLLELETGDSIWESLTYNTESRIALSEDATILAVASLTGVVLVYVRNRVDGGYSELWRYRFQGASSSWVSACEISLDGRTIAAGTLDFYEDHYAGRLALFETFESSIPLWISAPLGDEISDVALSDDGSIIIASSWGDLNHQTPDLVIHERYNNEPFYTLSTSGSMRTVGISDDGSMVIVGGKLVHSRQFGRGGRASVVSVDIPGGWITGRVIDPDDEPLPGVTISASDNPYTAITDQDGEYELLIEVDENRMVDVTAHLIGYMDVQIADVVVHEGETVSDIDFRLQFADPPPENVRASQGERNRIIVNWDRYNGERRRDKGYGIGDEGGGFKSISVRAAVGEKPVFTGPTPWKAVSAVDPLRSTAFRHPQRGDGEQLHATDAQNFNIYRSFLEGGPYGLIGSVDGEDTLYIDETGLFPEHRYYYTVTADFGGSESNYSDEAVGWLDDSFLNWEAELEPMVNIPQIDGTIDDGEWEDAVILDISDIYGYDGPDSAGSVEVRIGFDDDSNRLLLGFSYFVANQLREGMGVGVYVDDDGSGSWTSERPGSEGNYWGYWLENAPDLRFRSLTGPPYNSDPYYSFEDPELAFSDDRGYVEIEMALPLGFHDEREIGLYYPDYTIGLGLFAMQRDENENPLFNGWYPQDMFSIVSFPSQYARIHIPADLIVPPVEPTDVVLERDEDNLVLYWADPEFGIDGDVIEDLAGIHVYRNSELIGIVATEVDSIVDDDVIPGGWYEYSLSGFVLDGDEHFEGFVTRPTGMYAGEDPDVDEIRYDDDSMELLFVVAFQGEDNRFAVRFDLEEFDDWIAIYQIDFYAGSTEPIEVYIAEDDEGVPGEIIGERFLTQPYEQREMHSFRFPGIEQPIVVEDPDWFYSCWVVLDYLPDSPGAPAIGVDTSQPNSLRNMYYREETGWQSFDRGQLMIRTFVGQPESRTPVENDKMPNEFRVYQNYPNPFNGFCVIPVDITNRSDVRYELFDLQGRLISVRNFGILSPGERLFDLSVDFLGTGVYFVKFTSGKDQEMIKILLVR
ncbi:carboxypeptidase regulatory-like domain-containing protein [bacterium]|nr:carboxypeptidase regulatory-like domain-containing protein [bacterium]